MTVPTLTLGLPNFGSWCGGDWRGLVSLAQVAEAVGVDRVAVVDHVVMGRRTDAYVWGRFPTAPDGPWMEPISLLSAMTMVTSSIRLGTGILIAPLRPAAVLAKQVATLDVLSGGRVDLGVGVGWQKEEYDAVGLAFEERGSLLDDTIGACRVLWSAMPASYSSSSVSFEDTFCSPQPTQSRLPVWFSGSMTPRNVRRIRELGDGWIPIMGSTVDDVRQGCAQLADVGRDLSVQASLHVVRREDVSPDLAATVAAVPDWVAAGATDVYVNVAAIAPSLSAAPDTIAELVAVLHEVAA